MDITEAFLKALEADPATPELQVRLPKNNNFCSINEAALEVLTDATMLLIANIVATLIDAGSEREAVLENDTLREAILAEYTEWI